MAICYIIVRGGFWPADKFHRAPVLYKPLCRKVSWDMARSDLALYDNVLSSNLSGEAKSQLRRWYEAATSLPEVIRPSMAQVHGTVSAFRQGAESLLTGIALGAAEVELPGGLDPLGVPVDALGAGLFLGGSAIAAKSEMAPTARNIGSACMTVFGMRMTKKFMVEKRLAKGEALPKHLQYSSTVSGDAPARVDVSNDPIVRAAEGL